MSLLSRIFLLLSFVAILSPLISTGQHYIFIEADGQQPFYVKRADTLYSSSATGFLIIPKVPKGDFTILVGFPKAVYPEVTFDIKEISQDRGFHLKSFDGKGWGLFDRTSMEVIYAVGGTTDKSHSDSIKKSASPFAALLSDATGDDVLLEQKPVVTKQEVKKEVVNDQQTKEKINPSTEPMKLELPDLVKVEDLETDKEKIITFIDRKTSGKSDTVVVKIQKNVQVDEKVVQQTVSSETLPKQNEVKEQTQQTIAVTAPEEVKRASDSQTVSIRKLAECTKPFAEPKDVLNLQKKLLGMPELEEQLTYIEKVFGMKCFTSRQAVEISSFFLDEHSRMKLFKRVYWLVKDHDDFKQAGTLFFKDENIKAFKQLQSGN
jgi:hypothetical protein